MSKIDTMNSKSDLDYIADELFIELTSEASEVIQGGALKEWRNLRIAGSWTFAKPTSLGNFSTTGQFHDISVKLWNHDQDVKLTAKGTSGTGRDFEWEKTIPANDESLFSISTDVLDGTDFELIASTGGLGEEFSMNMTY